ncbi:hypothetical protein ACHAWU_009660 [Discostella pseudostelligera]|uniref:Acid phosphatase n=1 Tax=Discostella pseudostelligera TaxID=259834 RepID=A0ABD3N5Z1_9STRA
MTAHSLAWLLLASLCLFAAAAASSFSKQPHPNSKLRVCQVLIVHRHGDRTPITPLKNEDYWQSTLPERHVLEGIARGTTLIRPPTHSESGSGSTPKHHAARGRGPFGQLTMMGLLQMIRLGERLRTELSHHDDDHDHSNEDSQFVNQGKLFTPHQPLHPSRIKVMSTDFPRTIQSVQAVLTGLFPENGNKKNEIQNIEDDEVQQPITIDLQHTNSYFIPDPQPRQYMDQLELESHLSKRPHLIERDEELQHLAQRISEALDEHLGEGAHGVSFGIGEEKSDQALQQHEQQRKPLAWAQLCEILVCLQSHALLPPSLSHEDVEAVSNHVAWRWFENLRHPVLAKSSMWKFASSIVDTMQRKVQHDAALSTDEMKMGVVNTVQERESNSIEDPWLCIYSAHDSTLIGMLCVFQLEQPAAWPEYGSALKIELIREEEGQQSDADNSIAVRQHWVRFSLNGQLLRSTWCLDDNNEPSSMVALNELAEMIHAEHVLFEDDDKDDGSTALRYSWKAGQLQKH